jgi:hypothetical protein
MEVWLLVINKGFSVEMGLSGYNTERLNGNVFGECHTPCSLKITCGDLEKD